jgi:hypothetical protein
MRCVTCEDLGETCLACKQPTRECRKCQKRLPPKLYFKCELCYTDTEVEYAQSIDTRPGLS